MSRAAKAHLVVLAWCHLALYDCRRQALKSDRRPHREHHSGKPSPEEVLLAVDVACRLYWKRVWCLQRASVSRDLLQRLGIPARIVIGFRPVPLALHAWVEVEGRGSEVRLPHGEPWHVLCAL